MPTYDYVCDQCGHAFEEMQSFSADPLKTCPKCNQDTLRRLFGTGAAILFKGSGFYETDYRKDSYKEAAKADQSAAKPAGDSGSSSSGGAGGASTGGSATGSTGSSTGSTSSGGTGSGGSGGGSAK